MRFAYDIQKMRISQGLRAGGDEIDLDEKQKGFMLTASQDLHKIEKRCFSEIGKMLNEHGIYREWLKDQKGVGPAMAGVILSSFDIERANTASAFCAFAGLHVDQQTGKAPKPKKGEKLNYNPWVRSKLTGVLGDSFLRAGSDWRRFYDNYKHRKQNERVAVCMLCEGKKVHEGKKCYNCNGTGGPVAWGRNDAHRHRAAIRYMVKMFLCELWGQWRDLEGLPKRVPYAEEYLGRVHHG